MKYFTMDLFNKLYSEYDEISTRAEKVWTINCKAYWKYIDKIQPQVNPGVRKFLRTSLHDADILAISMGDTDTGLKYPRNLRTNSIQIKAIHPESGDLFTLTYSWIRDFKIEYHARTSYRDKDYLFFEQWGYDEFSLTKDKWVRHEILLSADTMVFIECKDFTCDIKKFKTKQERNAAIKKFEHRIK